MTDRLRRLLILLAPLLSLSLALVPAHAAFDESDAIEAFRPAAGSGDPFDTTSWNRFLAHYVVTDAPNGVHLVRYGAVSAEDRARLDAWIDMTAAFDPRDASREAQMAYWINLYNALTVQLILDHPSVDSIREISSGFLSFGPWDREVVTVAGMALTLNDIEHRILRPLFKDPRIHFAVNCASIGCPNLAAEAYSAKNLEALLDAGAGAYVNHPRGVRFEGSRLHLSSIFDWYRTDFPEGRAGLYGWLAEHAAPALAERLRAYDGGFRDTYDWALNAAP